MNIRHLVVRGLAVGAALATAAVPLQAQETTSAALESGDTVVSDFDDGTLASAFGAGWVETTDAFMGGESTAALAVVEGGAMGTSHMLHVSGEIAPGLPFAWGGAMFFPGARPMAPADLSSAEGIRFHARGDGQTYRILLFTRSGGQEPAIQTFTADSEWREHIFSWSDFNGSDGSDVMGIAVVGGPEAGPYEIWIDQVKLIPGEG